MISTAEIWKRKMYEQRVIVRKSFRERGLELMQRTHSICHFGWWGDGNRTFREMMSIGRNAGDAGRSLRGLA